MTLDPYDTAWQELAVKERLSSKSPIDSYLTRIMLRNLRQIVEPWGGTIEVISAVKFQLLAEHDAYSLSDFSSIGMGVHYADKRILMSSPYRAHFVAEVIPCLYGCVPRPSGSH